MILLNLNWFFEILIAIIYIIYIVIKNININMLLYYINLWNILQWSIQEEIISYYNSHYMETIVLT